VAQAEVWTARHTPAAVVADIYIGDDLSWGFMERLRDRLPEIPLIVTSAHDEQQTAIASGANLFVPKPLECDVLLRELRRLTVQGGTRRVLLVDDNEVARYILRGLLDQPWLEIREAPTGAAALNALSESLPDALILDLLMPDFSGFEILRQLRSNPATKSLPVLIYTSKVLSDAERTQLDSWDARVIRKEDVSSRLSAKPFLDWVKDVGLAPESVVRERNA
jgi:CheY-like chemotaxis protein